MRVAPSLQLVMMRFMRLGRLLSGAVELCYPSACVRCERIAEGKLCGSCEAELRATVDRARCEYCARPLVAGSECPYCRGNGVYPYERIATIGVFENALKDLIHRMKYHRRWGIGEELAERIAATPAANDILRAADVLIPVPLWRWRQVRRGYNQADVIASHLAGRFDKKVGRVVVRTRPTASQTEFRSGTSRVDNVRGAFRLRNATFVSGRRVVVVDDVMTSGATLKEVGRMILEANPAELSAIALAVADPRGRGFTAI
jgi:ComF family protein